MKTDKWHGWRIKLINSEVGQQLKEELSTTPGKDQVSVWRAVVESMDLITKELVPINAIYGSGVSGVASDFYRWAVNEIPTPQHNRDDNGNPRNYRLADRPLPPRPIKAIDSNSAEQIIRREIPLLIKRISDSTSKLIDAEKEIERLRESIRLDEDRLKRNEIMIKSIDLK